MATISGAVSDVLIGDFGFDQDAADRFSVTTNVTGWTDGAPVTDSIGDRVQQDGGLDGTGYFRARIITVEGFFDGATHDVAVSYADQLTALSPARVYPFAVSDSAGVRTADVRLTTAASVEWMTETAFKFTLQLKAPDPRKFGALQFATADLAAVTGTGWVWPAVFPVDWGVPPGVTPGAITVANAGTTAYRPRLRIDGPVTNPVVSLVESGARIQYVGFVPAGGWLDIDLEARRVLLNGRVSVRPSLSWSGDWLAVPPGGGTVAWVADDADPAALLSVWSYEGAWL